MVHYRTIYSNKVNILYLYTYYSDLDSLLFRYCSIWVKYTNVHCWFPFPGVKDLEQNNSKYANNLIAVIEDRSTATVDSLTLSLFSCLDVSSIWTQSERKMNLTLYAR